jgi:hypothetical protein
MVGKRLVDFLGERIREITNLSKGKDTRASVTVNVSQFHAPGGGDEVYQELSINITTRFLFIFSESQCLKLSLPEVTLSGLSGLWK